MNSIDAMQTEIRYQIRDLPRLKLPSTNKNCLFVGSGDSYAAALAAQYLSNGRALCCHPMDVVLNPSIVNGHDVYIVSISGNTKANILAAQAARKHGTQTTAITTKPASRLASVCDQVIELKYRSSGITTSGTISFTSSLLACASLVTKIQTLSLEKIYRQAEKQGIRIAGKIDKNSYVMLGNGLLYPAALYGSLKFNEVFGARAIPYPLEEFCHSPLFSIKKSDQVIVIGADYGLDKRLNKEGFSSAHVSLHGANIDLLLQSIFFMQLLVLKIARRRGLADCYFLSNKKLLKMSSDFIYG